MKNILFCLAGLLAGLSGVNAQQPGIDKFERGFTSWRPAENWEQSLLSGNGTMGAMVIGEPYDETIILSHAALYLPQQRSGKDFTQREKIQEIKTLLLAGKYKEAAAIPAALRDEQGYADQRDPFIPAFDLKIKQTASSVHQYQRSVNFETGEASVNWLDDAGTYSRKVFVSRTDSVVVIVIKSNDKINCELNFEQRPSSWEQWKFIKDGIKEIHSVAEDNWLVFNANFNHIYPGGLTGYAGVGRLIQRGGTHLVKDGKLVISNADEVVLLIRIRPDRQSSATLVSQLKKELSAFVAANGDDAGLLYTDLLGRHVQLHRKLFSKVKLDLGGTAEERNLTSEALIQRGNAAVSPALIEQVFDAGRYNILSSTGAMPPNLQGLWSGTWMTPWASGFTLDGNLPTAMSILLPGNMPGLMKGFFGYHERMMDEYRKEAMLLYGVHGIHIPAQITTRGVETDFGSTWCLTLWTGAAGWTANSFNDYYLYTGDKEFLNTQAYPFMKEAALFYEEFLPTGRDGKLVFNPSYSPENNPLGIESQAVINATMDVMIAKQLLRNCITAAHVLHKDAAKVLLWNKMLSQMPVYEVNSDGALKEWLWPGLKDNYSHRHSSQLYSLYDGLDPDFKGNPGLINAAKVLIGKKIEFRRAESGGEMAFGLVQLGTAAAHLGDAAVAGQVVNWLSSTYWTKGLGSYHNVKELFNVDISGGLPYLIMQMLCSAEPGAVNLLPALPQDWKKGKIEGLLLKGQLMLNSLEWDGGKVDLNLTSGIDQSIKVNCRGKIFQLHLKAGRPERLMISQN